MTVTALFLIALALSADAFTVAVCKGLTLPHRSMKAALMLGGLFGLFQGLMPIFGYSFGRLFERGISAYDHWVSFILLSAIGIGFIQDAFKEEKTEESAFSFAPLPLLTLALATSMDAFAVGITFALTLHHSLVFAAFLIATVTFVLCTAGVCLGNRFGEKYQNKAKIFGGILLILLALKVLFDGLYRN